MNSDLVTKMQKEWDKRGYYQVGPDAIEGGIRANSEIMLYSKDHSGFIDYYQVDQSYWHTYLRPALEQIKNQ